MASAALVLDDNSVLSELTEETKKSMPLLSPMTPVENKEITRACHAMAHRRASLSDSQHVQHASEDEDDARMRYIPNNSRRASMSGPTVEIRRQGVVVQEFVTAPSPQMLYQEDDARSNHSRSTSRRNSNTHRRPSVKGSATNAILLSVAGFTDDGDGYGTDNESVVSARSIRSMQRRASLQQKRRSSLSLQPAEPPCTPLSSSGSSTNNSVSELLAATTTNMPPYLNCGDDEEEEQDVVHHQPQNHRNMAPPRRGGRGGRGGVPDHRGVHRYGTNDSMTMMEMQQQQRYDNAEPPRRGNRHYTQQPQQQYEMQHPKSQYQQHEAPQRGVQRYGTSDSMGMINMQKGLANKNTSMPMGDAVVPPHAKSRRGGRRNAPEDPKAYSHDQVHHQHQNQQYMHPAPPQRGVQRYATNDSMPGMQIMDNNPNNVAAAAAVGSPRRGKRGMVHVMYTTGNTQDQDSDSSLSDPESDPASDPGAPYGHAPPSPQQHAPQRGVARYATNDSVTMQDMQSASAVAHNPRRSPRRGKRNNAPAGMAALSIDLNGGHHSGKQQQQYHAPPSQRGVARYGTNDSVTMQSMQVGSGGRSPRRGKRGTVQGLSQFSHDHDGREQQAQVAAPSQRGVARYGTNDSVTMQAMQVDSGACSPRRGGKRNVVQVAYQAEDDDSESSVSDPESSRAPAPPHRGVSRYSTNDSVTMQAMQADSSNARSPRRGKKPSAQGMLQGSHQEQGHHEAPPQRGVARFSTNDSVTMQSMQVDTRADGPRRGRRPEGRSVDGDEGDGYDLPPSDAATMNTTDDHLISVGSGSEPERGVVRTNTADSVELGATRQNGSVRRGGRRRDTQPVGDTNEAHGQEGEETEEEVEYVCVEEETTDDDEVVVAMDVEGAPARNVSRANTGDNMEVGGARENGAVSRGRRGDYEEEEKNEQHQPVNVDYGYDSECTDAPMQSSSDDMLSMVRNLQNPEYTNSQRMTRRGSTGVMPAEYTEHVAKKERSFRRASTGQSCQLELCPMPANSQSSRMGRRNSASSVFTARSEFSLRASYTPSTVSRQELRDMNISLNNSFHGGYSVSYLSSNPKRHDDSDSEDDVDYGYGDGNNAVQMYGYSAVQPPPPRRDSEYRRRGSQSSKSSSVKRKSFSRRGSKQGKALKQTAALMSGKGHASKGPHAGPSDSEDSTIYGYGVSERGGNDDDSMSESDMSMNSRSSRRSSRSRRNSVVILPGKEKKKTSGNLLGLEGDNDDGSDLLNNSAYLEYAIQAPPPSNLLDSEREKRYGAAVGAVQPRSRFPRNETPEQKPTHILKSKDDSWGRATPFTTPHSSLTKEALDRNLKAAGIPMEQAIHKISYHHRGVELDSSDDSSSDELYKDTRNLEGYDEYNQRARRRDSLDKTCINMGELLEERDKKDKKSKIPKFTPAVNCTNASDYIVRAFQARLRLGVTVVKHNRSRWSKSQQRELILLPDGRTLSWKPAQGENDKGKRPKLDLLKCIEVRHAWSKDPDTRKKLGTAVLRGRCKDGSASKSFSLIFNKKRTLDMTAMSTDCCKLLMEGFSALCFRLQMDRLSSDDHEHEHSDMDDRSHCNEGTRSAMTDDDWASTVYESTTSRTQTNTISASTVNSPWGL